MEDGAGKSRPGAPRSLGGWRTRVLVLGACVIPILLYAAIPAVASLPIPSGKKVAVPAALVPGREAVRRYLNPRTWFGRSHRG